MGLGQLTLSILVIAALISALVIFQFRRSENYLVTYLQSAVGCLFIFSGWVKVADPMGTGFKLEQYFAEFYATFEATWFSFIAPIFPLLSTYSLAFSVVVVIFEVLLGLMLVIGIWRKFTAWAFFLLVAFFTFLTGFTYLTGYVPSGTNFFQFAQWGEYDPSNMRVTDCGCFGDFLVIEPKVSFIKDLILLVPAIFFLFTFRKMHQLFSHKGRMTVLALSTIVLVIYAFSNFAWNLPHVDFRAFKEGTDIRTQYNMERDAASNVEVVAWKLQNRETGEVIELSTDVYFAELEDYPREEWEVVEQIQSEPEVQATKISDFMINDLEGNEVTYEILEHEDHLVMIVMYSIPASETSETKTVLDSIFVIDSTYVTSSAGEDSLVIERVADHIVEREVVEISYEWEESFTRYFVEQINPFINRAEERGIDVVLVSGEGNVNKIEAFQKDLDLNNFTFYFADDILLKTIIRSSPGVVWWKDGTILRKWHKIQLPEFEKAAENLLSQSE